MYLKKLMYSVNHAGKKIYIYICENSRLEKKHWLAELERVSE